MMKFRKVLQILILKYTESIFLGKLTDKDDMLREK